MMGHVAALMDHFESPRNVGRLAAPTAVGVAGTPGAGPFLVLQLTIDGGRVLAARYQTYGCGHAIAAGSVLTELIMGRTVAECLRLTDEEVSGALGGLPPHKFFCAGLAIEALGSALRREIARGRSTTWRGCMRTWAINPRPRNNGHGSPRSSPTTDPVGGVWGNGCMERKGIAPAWRAVASAISRMRRSKQRISGLGVPNARSVA